MKCILLGSGYSIPTLRRHNTSLFLQKSKSGLLIDCNGVCAQRLIEAGIAFEELEHIFLTHEHLDHIGALANLIAQIWLKSSYYRPQNRRTAPMNFYGNARTLNIVKTVFEAHGVPQSPHIFPIEYHPLPESGGQIEIAGIDFDYIPVKHASTPCFGLLVRGDKRDLVYSADTEPVPHIYERMKDGDVLVHECNSVDDPVNPGHTTWPQIQGMLKSLPAIELYLVHLPGMTDERESEFKAFLEKTYGTQVTAGEDGLLISL